MKCVERLVMAHINSILPDTLDPLQLDPGLPDGLPPGSKGRQQHVCHADPQHWDPSGVCTESPLLYSLFTYNCVAKHDANTIIKFADDSGRPDHRQR